jgi:hypothetical protein
MNFFLQDLHEFSTTTTWGSVKLLLGFFLKPSYFNTSRIQYSFKKKNKWHSHGNHQTHSIHLLFFLYPNSFWFYFLFICFFSRRSTYFYFVFSFITFISFSIKCSLRNYCKINVAQFLLFLEIKTLYWVTHSIFHSF